MLEIQIITIKGEPSEISGLLCDFDPEEFRVRVNSRVTELSNETEEALQSVNVSKEVTELKKKMDIVSEETPLIAELENLPHSKPEPVIKDKKPVDWRKYKKPAVRDKNCLDCGDHFHDDSKTNVRKWCDKCSPLHKPGKKQVEFVSVKETVPKLEPEPKPEPKPQPESRLKQKAESDEVTRGKRRLEKLMQNIKKPPVHITKTPLNKPQKSSLFENGEIKPPAHNRPAIILKANERICKNHHCKKVFKFEKLDQEFCSPECEQHKLESR